MPEVNFAHAEVLRVIVVLADVLQHMDAQTTLLQDILRDEGLGMSSTGLTGIFLARQVRMKFLLSCVQHVLQHVDAQTTFLQDILL